MHFHYFPNMATPYPKVHKIDNFGGTFLGHHYCVLSLSDPCLGVENTILKEKNTFSLYDLYEELWGPFHQKA